MDVVVYLLEAYLPWVYLLEAHLPWVYVLEAYLPAEYLLEAYLLVACSAEVHTPEVEASYFRYVALRSA